MLTTEFCVLTTALQRKFFTLTLFGQLSLAFTFFLLHYSHKALRALMAVSSS